MKTIFVAVAALLVSTLNAQAETSYFACTNGTIEEKGDAFFQVNLLEDGIEFNPWESHFSYDLSEVTFDGFTLPIVNKKTKISVEGDEQEVEVNALLVFGDQYKTLNLAISYDKGPFQTHEFTCVEKQPGEE